MKRKITLLLLAAGSLLKLNSQVLLSEDFNAPFSFGTTTSGWLFQNNSNPLGTTDWFQGNSAVFPSFNGGPNDYIGANFDNTGGTNPGTISNWLISPTVNLVNGNVIEFATRTGNTIPDRLGLYISTGTGTNVGALGNATAVGSFTNILTINSALGASVYPAVWTIYTATITGFATPTPGRFAFRYDVTNAGNAGANSNYIGIDAVKYILPCNQPTLVVTSTAPGVCSGGTVGLQVTTTGTVPATSYTWSTGQNGTSIVVAPGNSTVYTVSGENAGCIGTQTAAITVTATPTVQVPSYTVCSNPATSATLTATGASSYSWSTGSSSNAIVVTPASTTVYTVTGYALGGVCPSAPQTATVTVGTQLSFVINSTSNPLCSGRVATLTAISPATTYSWSTGQTVPTITVNPSTTTTYSVGGYSGTLPVVCAGLASITISVIPTPSLSVSISPTTICSEADFTVTTSGAVTYTYILGTQGFTNNPIELTAIQVNSVTVGSFIIAGTGANGCVAAGTVTTAINPNPTVTASSSAPTVCVNGTVTLTGAGAANYAWSGGSTATTSAVTYSSNTAGTKNFTLTGSNAAGCSASATLAVNVVTCTSPGTGINGVDQNDALAVFPNPFTNELLISDFYGTVKVYDALGKVVISKAVTASETINTSELPKGAYILKAHAESGELVRTVKLLKN